MLFKNRMTNDTFRQKDGEEEEDTIMYHKEEETMIQTFKGTRNEADKPEIIEEKRVSRTSHMAKRH